MAIDETKRTIGDEPMNTAVSLAELAALTNRLDERGAVLVTPEAGGGVTLRVMWHLYKGWHCFEKEYSPVEVATHTYAQSFIDLANAHLRHVMNPDNTDETNP